MLMGGWSNTISVTAPRARTWSRGSPTPALPIEQSTDRTLQRDPRPRRLSARGEEVDRGDRGHETRDRVGDRRAVQARRVVTGGPAAVGLGGRPVAGAVAGGERRDLHHVRAWLDAGVGQDPR